MLSTGTFIGMLTGLLIQMTLSDYIRPLLSDEQLSNSNQENYDVDPLQSLMLKDNAKEFIPSKECDKEGCTIDLNKMLTVKFTQGFGVKFFAEGMGMMNKSISIVLNDVKYKVSAEYVYTSVLGKPYSFWTTKNYDSDGYQSCSSGKTDMGLITADGTILDDTMKVVKSSVYKRTYGPTTSGAYKCNHYWLTSLDFCLLRTMTVDNSRGLVVYRLTDDITMNANLQLIIGEQKFNVEYSGSMNEPETVQFSDDLKIELHPIGKIPNPMVNNYIICDGSIDLKSNKILCNKRWYLTSNVPAKGSIPAAGIGLYQLVNLRSPSNLLFDPDNIAWDDQLLDCNTIKSKSKFYRSQVVKSDNNNFKSFMDNLFYGSVESTNHVTRPFTERINETIKNLRTDYPILFSDKDCCVTLTSSSNNYIDSVIGNLENLNKNNNGFSEFIPEEIEIDANGQPMLNSFVSRSLTTVISSSNIEFKGLRLDYDKTIGTIEKVIVPEMTYYENGAGSSFNFEILYKGPPGNIKIMSEGLVLLKEQYYIQQAGVVKDIIGFKSNGILSSPPTICFMDNKNCVQPIKFENKVQNDGTVDDKDSGNGASIGTRLTDFMTLVFSNFGFSVLCFLMWITDIIVMMIVFGSIVYLFKNTFLCLFMVCFSKGDGLLSKHFIDQFKPESDEVLVATKIVDMKYKIASAELVNILKFNPNDYSDSVSFMITAAFAHDQDTCTTGKDLRCKCTNISVDKKDNSSSHWIGATCFPFILRPPSDTYPFCIMADKMFDVVLFDETETKSLMEELVEQKLSTYNFIGLNYDGLSNVPIVLTKDITSGSITYYILMLERKSANKIIYFKSIKKLGSRDDSICIIDMYGETTTDYTLLKNLIDYNIQITGEYYISYFMPEESSDISSYKAIVNCVGKCEINMIIADENKNKKYKSSLNTRIKFGNPYNKKEIDDLKLFLLSTRKGLDIFKVHKSKDYLMQEQFHKLTTTEFKDYHVEYNIGLFLSTSENSDDISNIRLSSFNIIKKGFYDDNGIHNISIGGPIRVNCIKSNIKFSYCNYGNAVAVIENTNSNKKQTAKTLFENRNLEYTRQSFSINVSPTVADCEGELFIDGSSRLYCSNDCCLITENNWAQYHILDPRKPYKPSSLYKNIKIQQYKFNKLHDYTLSQPNGCVSTSFKEIWECSWQNFRTEMVFTFFSPLILLAIYLTSKIIKLLIKIRPIPMKKVIGGAGMKIKGISRKIIGMDDEANKESDKNKKKSKFVVLTRKNM